MYLDERKRAGEVWVRIALGEHASVPSFAKFVLELVSVGAPPQLLERAASAIADEVRHARLAFGYASKLLSRPIGPTALDIAGSLDQLSSMQEICIATFCDGCIEEGIAAEQARQASERSEGEAAAIWSVIAADEAGHADLAWATVEWLVEQQPALALVLQARLRELEEDIRGSVELALSGEQNEGLLQYGVLSRGSLAEIAVEHYESCLKPRALSLLGKACALA